VTIRVINISERSLHMTNAVRRLEANLSSAYHYICADPTTTIGVTSVVMGPLKPVSNTLGTRSVPLPFDLSLLSMHERML